MYVKEVQLTNIRTIQKLQWALPAEAGPGWHVVIGDNGSGKSSFLRAIALALVGPKEAIALRQDWNDWLRGGASDGEIELALSWNPAYDRFVGSGRTPKTPTLTAAMLMFRPMSNPDQVQLSRSAMVDNPERYIWGDGEGWFCASYGPFRRFSGGDKDQEKLYYSSPKLARHLSVFGESVALSECLEWLKLLQFKKLEQDPEGNVLEPLKQFINQPDFLPNEARLESISSKGVRFVDGNGCEVPVENLSDGYRSILSMTFELIRQLARAYGADKLFAPGDSTTIIAPGVVLIDEIDAHLHPVWQRRVGRWFREHFPNIQFIVTTHSPLICQAATVGSVFRLPRPGSDEEAGMVTGVALDRLLYGNVLDAYSTGAFGDVDLRSDEGMEKLERLATLNQKELEQGLSSAEQAEQQQLRAQLPTASSDLPSDTEVPQP
ncbi:AAA family ATPase [Corallococcus exiguus]|uniref:AAA family ATPase n=1 Tax=Corallococcus exiguus TaxID=83462 RepID=UPI00147132C1|nr:AAA family ATPase [Corallococcus exiguus]NNB88913.1 AAA family ATPase [Corallococcus exiguus]NNC03656.1 AAA family ATPase [Corallococcus exiguus]